MSRKTFGGWGFALDPEWRAHIAPHPLLFKGRRGEGKEGGTSASPNFFEALVTLVFRE